MLSNYNRSEKYIILGELCIFTLLGIYTLMLGILLPLIQEEYLFNDEVYGYLMSAGSFGVIVIAVLASYAAIAIGLKRAYVLQQAFVIVGLILWAVSGDIAILTIGMILVGFARGATANYSNQIVNDITNSSSVAMNVVGVFFALGSFFAPFIIILFTSFTGDWRFANYGVCALAAIGIIITLFMKLGKEGAKSDDVKRGGLSFFRLKKYWVMLIALFCYLGMEVSIVGWLSKYYMDTHDMSDESAFIMAAVFWGAILVGRVVCSFIAKKIEKAKLILYLSIGSAVFAALFASNMSLAFLIAATVGLGLLIAGNYSTILADTGYIFKEYKLAFGYFIAISGLGPVVMSAIIGVISERYNIQAGIIVIFACAVLLLIASIVNLRLNKRPTE